MARFGRVLTTLGLATAMALTATPAQAAPSDQARAELRAIVENVNQATAKRYNARDDAGHVMDTAKIIQDSSGGYLAVYHHLSNGAFKVNLATSTDLLNWHWVRELAGSVTGPASQPTIVQASNGGFVLAWEQENPGGGNNHLAFRYYADKNALLAGSVARSFDAPRRLSSCAEGTPNIYSVTLSPDIDHSVIDIGAHYWWNCDRDRQQRGRLTNFNSWSTSAQPNVDNAMLHWGVGGNIGDRDQIFYQGFSFGLFEGQFVKGDFGSWRTFVYDYQTGNADQTTIRTDGGSTAFANPTITSLRAPNGQPAILVTLFVPSEGSAPGESGELIYYKTL
ncbi:hypothetical protein [Tenggerimyces flavus]|uniref:Uncharacterized protein n=1 Tax=Tenggerimyces flavus TaxID=1708749 RepID=A0ABV7Y8K9_9ACTN|nr:hypothetical protein [Tenggerimyces flavus]MBM7785147.1 hypothetical protein [Tenggerimyces flavus]